jgi:hypothetical protein
LRQKIRPDRECQSLRGHQPFQSIDEAIPILLQGLPRPMELSRIFLLTARHAHRPPDPPIPQLMPREHIQQASQIERVRLRAPRTPIHLDARRIDHRFEGPLNDGAIPSFALLTRDFGMLIVSSGDIGLTPRTMERSTYKSSGSKLSGASQHAAPQDIGLRHAG